nr:unnamed protein product [Callosobruchus analis]
MTMERKLKISSLSVFKLILKSNI